MLNYNHNIPVNTCNDLQSIFIYREITLKYHLYGNNWHFHGDDFHNSIDTTIESENVLRILAYYLCAALFLIFLLIQVVILLTCFIHLLLLLIYINNFVIISNSRRVFYRMRAKFFTQFLQFLLTNLIITILIWI